MENVQDEQNFFECLEWKSAETLEKWKEADRFDSSATITLPLKGLFRCHFERKQRNWQALVSSLNLNQSAIYKSVLSSLYHTDFDLSVGE